MALSALDHDILRTDMKVKCEGKVEMYGQKYMLEKKGQWIYALRNGIKQS